VNARRLLLAAALVVALPLVGQAADYVELPGGSFRSVTAGDATGGLASVERFQMRTVPVTRGEFAAFVASHPAWRRDRVPRVFADTGYLSGEPVAGALSAADAPQPVTHVSWFAAQAFCESEGARLPTWNEWEFGAAADTTRIDARDDPAWRARILAWYARPATAALPAVGGEANVYGVRDLHGLVWEWTEDFNALLVNGDSRSADDPDRLKFCGAGAINLQQRENYAVLMRVALLSSLNASDSTGSLGFRCVRPTRNTSP
jgi:formylglycine-generating enzyme